MPLEVIASGKFPILQEIDLLYMPGLVRVQSYPEKKMEIV